MDPLYFGCELLRESFVYYAMDILGYYGHGYFGVPLGLALIAVGYKRQSQHFKLAGIAVLLSIASTGVLTEALKHIFQMPRPRSAGSYAFPSGHSGTAFAIASTLSVSFPALTPLYFLFGDFDRHIAALFSRALFDRRCRRRLSGRAHRIFHNPSIGRSRTVAHVFVHPPHQLVCGLRRGALRHGVFLRHGNGSRLLPDRRYGS